METATNSNLSSLEALALVLLMFYAIKSKQANTTSALKIGMLFCKNIQYPNGHLGVAITAKFCSNFSVVVSPVKTVACQSRGNTNHLLGLDSTMLLIHPQINAISGFYLAYKTFLSPGPFKTENTKCWL